MKYLLFLILYFAISTTAAYSNDDSPLRERMNIQLKFLSEQPSFGVDLKLSNDLRASLYYAESLSNSPSVNAAYSVNSDVWNIRALGSNFEFKIYEAKQIRVFTGVMGEYAFYSNRSLMELGDSYNFRRYEYHDSRSTSIGLLLKMEFRQGNLGLFCRLNSTFSYITDPTYSNGYTTMLYYTDLSRSGIGISYYIF